jgi:hypothetical protein
MPPEISRNYAAFSAIDHIVQTNWYERHTICDSRLFSIELREVQNQASCCLNAHARLVILRMLYVNEISLRKNTPRRVVPNETIVRLWMPPTFKVQA